MKTVNNLPLGGSRVIIYGPQTYKKIGTYGVIAVIAFVLMLLTLYAPEISTIGESTGIGYDLVP